MQAGLLRSTESDTFGSMALITAKCLHTLFDFEGNFMNLKVKFYLPLGGSMLNAKLQPALKSTACNIAKLSTKISDV